MIRKIKYKEWIIEYETDHAISQLGCLLRYLTFKRNNEKVEITIYTNNVKKSIETILLKAKETRDILKYNEDIFLF